MKPLAPIRHHGWRQQSVLLGQGLARAAHFLGQVAHLWQTVVQGQPRFLVVDMHARLEGGLGQQRGVDVGQLPERVLGKQMAAGSPLTVNCTAPQKQLAS